MKNNRVLTKKEIKNFKKELLEWGASSEGFYNEIFSEMMLINHRLFFEIVNKTNDYGIRFNEKSYSFENFVINEFVKEIGYQDFKKLVPYFLGFASAYFECGKVYI